MVVRVGVVVEVEEEEEEEEAVHHHHPILKAKIGFKGITRSRHHLGLVEVSITRITCRQVRFDTCLRRLDLNRCHRKT
jgi:hypothetical protein